MTYTDRLKFIDPKNDVAFKKIFGDENHRDVLLEFLNEVLAPENPILEVQIMNPYQLPRTQEKAVLANNLDLKVIHQVAQL